MNLLIQLMRGHYCGLLQSNEEFSHHTLNKNEWYVDDNVNNQQKENGVHIYTYVNIKTRIMNS